MEGDVDTLRLSVFSIAGSILPKDKKCRPGLHFLSFGRIESAMETYCWRLVDDRRAREGIYIA